MDVAMHGQPDELYMTLQNRFGLEPARGCEEDSLGWRPLLLD